MTESVNTSNPESTSSLVSSSKGKRQIVLDTETTGLEPQQGHRIIEIGCVELEGRRLTGRHYHQYINPEREIDSGAIEVHGITNEFLADKPLFAQISQDFLNFVGDDELIIHNAPFDVGFINNEFKLMKSAAPKPIDSICKIIDSLAYARKKHPGQRNSLDALCRRYGIDNTHRELHGALLDAEILADVYLLMTGGQVGLALAGDSNDDDGGNSGNQNAEASIRRLAEKRSPLMVLSASEDELQAHQSRLDEISKICGELCSW